jgi:hypothetical protein
VLERRHKAIFEELKTHDFERVLRGLRDAIIVNRALGLEERPLGESYEVVQRALGEAIAQTHIGWAMTPTRVLRAIRTELVKYRFVFSTNYDLLIYWSILCEDPNPSDVKDLFWTPGPDRWLVFDPSNTKTAPEVTRVMYLHGGLHIYSLFDGTTAKYVPAAGENLLDAFQRFVGDADPFGPIPLLVTEGDAEDKRAVIESSAYLSFAYQQLVMCQDPIVVFGQGLGEGDAHIARALNSFGGRQIAIALLPDEPDELVSKQAHYQELLPRARLSFFDATTHPLGAPSLRVDPGRGD